MIMMISMLIMVMIMMIGLDSSDKLSSVELIYTLPPYFGRQ